MTLIEVMISLLVFSTAILGTFGLSQFAMRNMDSSRTITQVTQILTHEMEAMRLRSWNSQAASGHLTVRYMADNAANYATFTPFADYGSGDVAVGSTQPAVSTAVLGSTKLQLRNAAGFKCTRAFALNTAKDTAEITLKVEWTDERKLAHSRTLTTTASANGINDAIFCAR